MKSSVQKFDEGLWGKPSFRHISFLGNGKAIKLREHLRFGVSMRFDDQIERGDGVCFSLARSLLKLLAAATNC